MSYKIKKMINKKMILSEYASPFGELVLGACDESICLCLWKNACELMSGRVDERMSGGVDEGMSGGVLAEAKRQLELYFQGRLRVFQLPLLMTATGMTRRVLEALEDVPYGETVTYGELARRIGNPGAARAVGRALGRNPLHVIIPCHRVVAARGRGGYAGGVEHKAQLLELEAGGVIPFLC